MTDGKQVKRAIPVCIVVLVILGLWATYLFLHLPNLLPFLGSNVEVGSAKFIRGVVECSIFHVLLSLLLISYIRTVMTKPGTTPNSPDWEYVTAKETSATEVTETKRSGELRFCKWCAKYKPDRCHHCRICNNCVLKMDHHCPWMNNCIGFHNHKYFMLTVHYATFTLVFLTITMGESLPVNTAWKSGVSVIGEILAILLSLLFMAFYGFHIYLCVKGYTTIEFCEKQRTGDGKSRYHRGVVGNIKAVLGPHPILWFIPCNPPTGDGLSFITEESSLNTTPWRSSKKKRKDRQSTDGESDASTCSGHSRSPSRLSRERSTRAVTIV